MRNLRPTVSLALTFLIVASACGDGGGAPDTDSPDSADMTVDAASDSADSSGDDGADVPGDAALDADSAQPPSPLYVLPVEDDSQLIGGPGAYGEVGHAWLIGNDVARFIIQGIGPGVGLSLFGGNLIDADLVRPDGEPGRDAFREMFPVVDFRVLIPDSITVFDDGSSGEEAILRVEGELGPSGILDLLDVLAGSADLRVTLDYIIRPGEPVLTLRTHLTNRGTGGESVSIGDFLGFGDQLSLFTREAGYGKPETAGDPTALGSRGDGVSYAYSRAEGGIILPFSDNSGTAGFLDMGLEVPAGQTVSIERFFVVGTGSPSSALDVASRLRGEILGDVAGRVSEVDGSPVTGARVLALPMPEGGGEPTFATGEAATDAEGRFEMALKPGDYQLHVTRDGRIRPEPQAISVVEGSGVEADFELSPPAIVQVSVSGDGASDDPLSFPVAVKLQALDAQSPDARLGELSIAGQAATLFWGPGGDTFEVAPGRYRAVISHGPEYERLVLDGLELLGGVELVGHLSRSLQTTGYLGCDFHQHTIGSLDSDASLADKLRENLAEGLECAAITDHDNVLDIRPTIAAMGAGELFLGIIGNEVSVNGVGHFNAYPLPIDPAAPYALVGAKMWAGRTIAQLFEFLRSLPGERVLQINHPRSDPLKGYFSFLRLDPWTGEASKGTLPLDFDGLEVNDSLGSGADYTPEGWAAWREAGSTGVPVMADWFGMLNRGMPVCALGNSDSHDVGDGVGYPRTYLDVGTNLPGEASEDAVVEAIHRQKGIISRGAWLDVTVDGARAMGHAEVVEAVGETVSLHVVATTPSWLALDVLEIYQNGLRTHAIAHPGPAATDGLWFDETVELELTRDSWVVVVVRGPAMGQPVFGGFTYALTNPIYVDLDGGGFAAPGPVVLPTP